MIFDFVCQIVGRNLKKPWNHVPFLPRALIFHSPTICNGNSRSFRKHITHKHLSKKSLNNGTFDVVEVNIFLFGTRVAFKMAEIIYRRKEASTMALPNPGLQVDEERTALVITAPQNDFLSPLGVTWKSQFFYSEKSDWEGEQRPFTWCARLILAHRQND